MDFDLEMPDKPVETKVDSHRPGVGWAAFGLLILLLVVWQGYYYFTRPTEKTSPYERYDQVLRMGYTMNQALKGIEIKPKTGASASEQSLSEQFSDSISELAGPRKKDPVASMVYIGMRDALGKQIISDDYAILEASKDDSYLAFAEIYRRKTITKERAEELSKKLPDLFASRVARIHAFTMAGEVDAAKRIVPLSEALTMSLAISVLGFAFCTGSVLWGVYWFMRSSGRLKPLGHRADPLTFAQSDRLAMRAAQLLALTFFVGSAVPILLNGTLPRGVATVIGTGASIIAMIGLAGFPVSGRSILWSDIGWSKLNLGKNILWGVGGLMAEVPLVLIAVEISQNLFTGLPEAKHPMTVALESQHSPWMIIGAYVAAVIGAPVIEETIFRGMVAPAMVKLTGSFGVGIVTSGLCFAAIHPTGIPAWPPLAAFGVMGALLNYQTRSIVPSVVLHALHNAVLVTIALMIS